MNERKVTIVFPTTITFGNIDRKFSNSELEFFKKQEENVIKNEGNITSMDSYLFKHKVMNTLHNEVLLSLQHYINNIIVASDKVKPYVTQSWLNYTDPGQYHHVHSHPNSFLSGVVYIDADEKYDSIVFCKNQFDQIKLQPKEFNLHNSESWAIPVKTGDIIVFPSSLMHRVDKTINPKTRISLSFNSFLRGNIGDKLSRSELIDN
jgi:uncharacterized protein (TIGR02466 family)